MLSISLIFFYVLNLFFHSHILALTKAFNLSAQNNKILLAHVKNCPEIYKLRRKQVVCNVRFEAKTFIFLTVSSRKSVFGLKWTNDEDIEFINSKLSTNGNIGQKPLIPQNLFPEVNHMPMLSQKVAICCL